MVNDHAHEGPRADERIELSKRAVRDPLLDVCAHMVTYLARHRFVKHPGKVVSFERAEEEQADQGPIFGIKIEQVESQRAKKRPVVLAPGGVPQTLPNSFGRLPNFMIKNRRIDRLFVGEVAEDDSRTDPRAIGDLFGQRAVETSERE